MTALSEGLVHLSARERALFDRLQEEAGWWVGSEDLKRAVWGDGWRFLSSNTKSVNLLRTRRKLADTAWRIETRGTLTRLVCVDPALRARAVPCLLADPDEDRIGLWRHCESCGQRYRVHQTMQQRFCSLGCRQEHSRASTDAARDLTRYWLSYWHAAEREGRAA